MRKLILCFGISIMMGSIAMGTLVANTVSHRFERVLHTFQEMVEQKVLKKNYHYAYNPLTLFYRGVSIACNDFAAIEQDFLAGTFADHKNINTKFEALCRTIVDIDKMLYKPSNLRPRHIRWLNDASSQLGKAARTLPSKTIQNFAMTMNRDVLPHCARYIGTGFEHMRDFLVHRPWEFFKRNWWWTIPTTAAGAKIAWDALNFPEDQRQNPTDWNTRANNQPDSSWYKKLVSLIAGGMFASKLAKGYTKMDGHTYVGHPIGLEQPAGAQEAQYKQYEQRIVRGDDGRVIGDPQQVEVDPYRFQRNYLRRVITQLPCLRQKGMNCGFHSLYNAVCIATRNYAGLVDPATFQGHLRAWQTFLNQDQARAARIRRASGFIGVDDMEEIIRNFDYFAPIRRNAPQRMDQNNGGVPVLNHLQNNVSIIFDLNGLEAIFQRPQDNAAVLLAGNHNHVLSNIDRFRNHNAHQQTIIVNLGYIFNGYSRGAHWFVMEIEHDPASQTDFVLITESTAQDYRKREIIDRVYRLFRTDRANGDLPQ